MENEKINPVSIADSEAITKAIVTPILETTFYQSGDGKELPVEFRIQDENGQSFYLNRETTIKCLHFWQGLAVNITMKMQAMDLLADLEKTRMLINSFTVSAVCDKLNQTIVTANDNIAFLTEELLKFGIKV